ncbi:MULTISPECIES: hypothetical protein [unclassified Corynebacterium]|uniref:hypothetical protein n=1 Tax=unclassified Corynebacterium TaxID=2624378 RepID=UPI0029C9CB14|nr:MULTISPECIES: hypothetical protein [unclassified Corynebacterium]WPF66467.1 hypothetical protein OLX12_01705 [Corynebacterium sp. 22KM0430]WPF68957.1 hypothetical protein OLW90_01705 [Corynebacterium sp. 21KM1197]
MKDPTRIEPLLGLLRDAWEAQPDLALSELWGILENRGIGWGATDEQVSEVLRHILREHPLRVGEEPVLVYTTQPEYLVTIHPEEGAVVVRHPDRSRQPAWWSLGEVVRARVGAPLVLRDGEGIDHRLGVVRGIDALRGQRRDLSGLRRDQMGDEAYACRLDSGDLVVIGHGMDVYAKERRSVVHSALPWEKIKAGAPGTGLVIQPQGESGERELGTVSAVLPLA